MTNILNCLSGRLLVSISFSYFTKVMSYSFTWNIFLCVFILPNSMSLFQVLVISATFPGFKSVSLCRCPGAAQ